MFIGTDEAELDMASFISCHQYWDPSVHKGFEASQLFPEISHKANVRSKETLLLHGHEWLTVTITGATTR